MQRQRRYRRHDHIAPVLWITGMLVLALVSVILIVAAPPRGGGVVQTPNTGIPGQVLFRRLTVQPKGSAVTDDSRRAQQ
jgi:hypothetical protein